MKLNLSWPGKTLIYSLCLSVSGIGPVVYAATNSPVPSQVAAQLSQATTEGDSVESRAEDLVRAARFPGTPGTDALPSYSDVTSLESAILKWKGELEKLLALPNAQEHPGAGLYLPTDTKLTLINAYFDHLASLISLRIALGLSHGPAYRDTFSLQVPRAIMTDFPGLGAPAQDRLGDRFLPLSIDSGSDGKADPVSLKLSENLVQGLEIGRLSDQPDDASFLTMVQYLTTRQLLQNLSALRYLKTDHTVQVPEIPELLREKLDTLGFSQQILDEQNQVVSETDVRKAMAKSYDQYASRLPEFIDDSLAFQIASVIADGDASMRAEMLEPFKTSLRESEKETVGAALDGELTASSQALASLPEEVVAPTIRYVLARAAASTVMNKLLSLMNDGSLALSRDQRAAILSQLEARKKSFAESVSPAVLHEWISSARSTSEQELYPDHRAQFIEDLLVKSREVSKKVREQFAGNTVEPGVLVRAFAQDLYKLGARPSVQSWLHDIAGQGTYVAARDKYASIVSKAASPAALRNGIVIPELVLAYVDSAKFPQPKLHFSDKVNPKIRDFILKRLVDGRKADLRNLVKIGDWFGFNRAIPLANPSIYDILDSDHQSKYFDALKEDVIDSYRVLSQEVSVQTPDGGYSSMPLYDALSDLNPDAAVSPEIIASAEPLVDQALDQVEAAIDSDIQTAGNATSLKDLEKVAQGSMMTELVMLAYPEFKDQQDQFLENLLDPSLTSQIMNRYVGRYLIYGSTAIILLKIAQKFFKEPDSPLSIVMLALEPVISGYEKSALVLMLADSAYQAYGLNEARKKRNQTEEFFGAGLTGSNLFSDSEMQATNTAYEWSKWMFIGNNALLFAPMVYGGVTKIGANITLREFQADIESFKALGLKPGEWNRLDDGIAIAREHADIIGPDAAAEAERAYVRLSSKVKAGTTWDLAQIEAEAKPENMSKATKRLRKILKSHARAGGRK